MRKSLQQFITAECIVPYLLNKSQNIFLKWLALGTGVLCSRGMFPRFWRWGSYANENWKL